MQVRRRHLVPAFEQAGRITKRRNHVKHDHLRVKAPREPSGLEEGMPGHVGGHNGNKNFLKAQHRAIPNTVAGLSSGSYYSYYHEKQAPPPDSHKVIQNGDGHLRDRKSTRLNSSHLG